MYICFKLRARCRSRTLGTDIDIVVVANDYISRMSLTHAVRFCSHLLWKPTWLFCCCCCCFDSSPLGLDWTYFKLVKVNQLCLNLYRIYINWFVERTKRTQKSDKRTNESTELCFLCTTRCTAAVWWCRVSTVEVDVIPFFSFFWSAVCARYFCDRVALAVESVAHWKSNTYQTHGIYILTWCESIKWHKHTHTVGARHWRTCHA